MRFDVYFDYNCRYSYELALLLNRAREQGRREFTVTWRFFSLTQVNNLVPGWTIWGAGPDEPAPGRLAFLAAAAARRLGRFDDMHWRLLTSRHVDHAGLENIATIAGAAARAGLDPRSLLAELEDEALAGELRREHSDGVELGIFGTPTLVFEGGASAYVRIRPAPPAEEAGAAFDELCRTISQRVYLRELKRPPGPSPKR